MDHRIYDPAKDYQYWDFTWADMAKYDVPAMVDKIKLYTSKEKIFYIGYSQGSAQIFTALAKDYGGIKDSLHKVIALSPCVLFSTNFEGKEAWKSEKFYEMGLYTLPSMGIHAFKGPNWENDLRRICKEMRQEVCDEFIKLDRSTSRSGSPY